MATVWRNVRGCVESNGDGCFGLVVREISATLRSTMFGVVDGGKWCAEVDDGEWRSSQSSTVQSL